MQSQSSTATAAVSSDADGDAAGEQRVSVKTDVIDVTLSSVGGTVIGVNLLKYPVSLKESDTPFTLASDTFDKFLVAQSDFYRWARG